MKKFYTPEEYAKIENVEVRTIYNQMKSRKLLAVDIKQKLPKLIYTDFDANGSAIISLMNLKGGCGKTTIAVHLASMLARLNFKTLLIDGDHQNQCEMFFQAIPYKYTIKNVIEGYNIKDCIYQVQTGDSLLDIIFSDYDLALVSSKFNDDDLLINVLEPIKDNYDFIIIDTSPNFDIININVARASTHIIIPIIPQPLHIKGMQHNIKALKTVANIPMDRIIGIIPSIVKPDKSQQKAYIELLKEENGDLLYDAIIPEDTFIPKVNDARTTIFDLREKSKGSQAFKTFTWETLRRI